MLNSPENIMLRVDSIGLVMVEPSAANNRVTRENVHGDAATVRSVVIKPATRANNNASMRISKGSLKL